MTIHEAKPLHIAQGNLPLAVESYELFRRLATDAMTTLDLPKPVAPSAATGEWRLWDTGGRDRRPAAVAARPRRTRPSTPPRSPGSPAVGSSAPPPDPIRGAAVDSRRVEPGNLFVALPGERTDGHEHLAAAVEAGAAAAARQPAGRAARRRSATSA